MLVLCTKQTVPASLGRRFVVTASVTGRIAKDSPLRNGHVGYAFSEEYEQEKRRRKQRELPTLLANDVHLYETLKNYTKKRGSNVFSGCENPAEAEKQFEDYLAKNRDAMRNVLPTPTDLANKLAAVDAEGVRISQHIDKVVVKNIRESF